MHKLITKYLGMLAFFMALPVAASATFSDVPENDSNYDAIMYVQEKGIVNGYDDGTFRAHNAINRAEFTKIVTLYRWGEEVVGMCGSKHLFPDLEPNAWYTKYICRARDAHLVQGYPDGNFRPENKINFAEAAKIIASASSQNTSDPRLPVVGENAPWYETFVRFLSEINAIPTSIWNLDQPISRGEMAEIIYRLDANVTNKSSVPYDNFFAMKAPVNYKTYINEGQQISFRYPPPFNISSDQIRMKYSSGKNWYRAELFNGASESNPFVTMEVNPDGYGPIFWDVLLTVEEYPDGSLHIVNTEKEDNFDDVRIIVVKSFEARNGNNYYFRFSHRGDINWEGDFYDILHSVRIGNQEIAQTFTHTQSEYSIDYPSDWTVEEDIQSDERWGSVVRDLTGTKIIAPQGTQAAVFLAIPSSCPDLSGRIPSSNPYPIRNVTINGREFDHIFLTDGAAGSIGENKYYTSQIDGDSCIVISSHYFHTTGDAYDEPERSRVKKEIEDMQNTIEEIVNSFR